MHCCSLTTHLLFTDDTWALGAQAGASICINFQYSFDDVHFLSEIPKLDSPNPFANYDYDSKILLIGHHNKLWNFIKVKVTNLILCW